MKNIFKELIFNTLGFFTLFFFKWLISKNKIFVVNFHATYPEYNKNFIKQLNFLKKYFYLNNFESVLNQSGKSSKPSIILTFDDGHVSNFQAAKILNENNISAIYFIPYNFVYRNDENNFEEEYLTTVNKFNILSNKNLDKKNNYTKLSLSHQNLLDLKKMNFSIGSHTLNHVRLTSHLKDWRLKDEIIKSKINLEKKLNIKIDKFAWVIGDTKSYSSEASNIIKKNYKYAFMTCCKSFENINYNPYQIHRFNIESSFSIKQISFILSGFYEIMYSRKRKIVNKITN